jgi:hypothetical protein
MKRLVSKGIVMIASTMVVLATWSVPKYAQTPEKPAPSKYSAVPPAGHEAFFKDLGELMSKYPESAKRFAISDQQIRPTKNLSEQQQRRRNQCPEGQGCGFYCWTSPVTFECCECNIRPK